MNLIKDVDALPRWSSNPPFRLFQLMLFDLSGNEFQMWDDLGTVPIGGILIMLSIGKPFILETLRNEGKVICYILEDAAATMGTHNVVHTTPICMVTSASPLKAE
jgi:hypothetical protein